LGELLDEELRPFGRRDLDKGRESLDLDFFCDDEAAAPLFAGGLSDDGDCVTRARAETTEGAGAWGGARKIQAQRGALRRTELARSRGGIRGGIRADDDDGGDRGGLICIVSALRGGWLEWRGRGAGGLIRQIQ
jgi:hypothetical protein